MVASRLARMVTELRELMDHDGQVKGNTVACATFDALIEVLNTLDEIHAKVAKIEAQLSSEGQGCAGGAE